MSLAFSPPTQYLKATVWPHRQYKNIRIVFTMTAWWLLFSGAVTESRGSNHVVDLTKQAAVIMRDVSWEFFSLTGRGGDSTRAWAILYTMGKSSSISTGHNVGSRSRKMTFFYRSNHTFKQWSSFYKKNKLC